MKAWLPWILTAIALGMAIYPILHLVPDKAQKHRMRLRQAALQKGIRIEIRHPQLPPELADQYPDTRSTVAYYLPQELKQFPQTFMATRSQLNGWLWLGTQPPAKLMQLMLTLYDTLPDYVLAVEQSPAGSSVFWNELNAAGDIDAIHQCLQQLNQL